MKSKCGNIWEELIFAFSVHIYSVITHMCNNYIQIKKDKILASPLLDDQYDHLNSLLDKVDLMYLIMCLANLGVFCWANHIFWYWYVEKSCFDTWVENAYPLWIVLLIQFVTFWFILLFIVFISIVYFIIEIIRHYFPKTDEYIYGTDIY